MPTAVDMASGMCRPIACEKRVSRSAGAAAGTKTGGISQASANETGRERRRALGKNVDVQRAIRQQIGKFELRRGTSAATLPMVVDDTENLVLGRCSAHRQSPRAYRGEWRNR